MNGNLYCTKCGAPNPAGTHYCGRCGASMSPLLPATPGRGVAYAPVSSAVAAGYGGFWIRVVAAIIDGIIVQVAVFPLAAVFGGMGGLTGLVTGVPHVGLHLLGSGLGLLFGVAGSWLYEAFMQSSTYQATLGKMILGMRVTDLYGNRISFGRATGRHFAKWLSGMMLCIGYIMVGLTQRKQGLHDMLAGTLVRRA